MCGIEDAHSWVSLGFSSPLDAKDVLHILCSRVADPDDPVLGTADLYFERFDQAYCCYGGADEVSATRSSMQLLLNEKGREALAFEGMEIWFEIPPDLGGYEEALGILQQMADHEYGKSVMVDLPPHLSPRGQFERRAGGARAGCLSPLSPTPGWSGARSVLRAIVSAAWG